MKHKTGNYCVITFDEHGTKVQTHWKNFENESLISYGQSMAYGRAVAEGGSFVVMRVVHNTLDPRGMW